MDDILYDAIETILKICSGNGNMKVKLDMIHNEATNAIIAYEMAKQMEEKDGKEEN